MLKHIVIAAIISHSHGMIETSKTIAQAPAVSQAIVDRYAEEKGWCDLPHHPPKPGQIVIEWKRVNGVCRPPSSLDR